MNKPNLSIDSARLFVKIEQLAKIGATPEGGCRRLALTQEDKAGRDLVVSWMRDAGLKIHIDQVGNIHGLSQGPEGRAEDIAPVMTGSHIDTVGNGGKFDGMFGVLSGLEVVETLRAAGIQTRRPLCVSVFTNEEGVRFQPDMMGSLVYAGGMSVEDALNATDNADLNLGDELQKMGYAGDMPCGRIRPHAYVELHIEQGPVLEEDGIAIGAVENLQGISWTRMDIKGQANHAGTTPMRLRHDAGFAAASIVTYVRQLTRELGDTQLATVGFIDLTPNLINVIPGAAHLSVDLRNTDEATLQTAESKLEAFIRDLEDREGVKIESERLARFQPVQFDSGLVAKIEQTALALGHSCRRMTSGAGHDAQMMARLCPSAMIFVPSRNGISHNPAEHTDAADLEAGANVLLHTLLELAE